MALLQNPYFKDEKPQLYNSYCAFLDILGFSEKIKTDSNGDYLREFYPIFKEIVDDLLESAKDDPYFHYGQFTDNIFIAKPDTEEDHDAHFGWTLMDIREYQFKMAVNGYFVRGGFALGKLFMDDHLIYGEALLEAYSLESTKAKYPVVLLSERLKARVNQFKHYYNSDICPIRCSLLELPEKGMFINYLSELLELESLGESPEQLEEYLISHKEQVMKNLDENKNIPGVYEKYLFISHYHNYCLEDLGYKRFSSRDLTIDTDDSVFKFEFYKI